MMVVGLITDGDETAYREEVRDLAVWCQDNNLYLNDCKTKKLTVDYRNSGGCTPPIHIDWRAVDRVKNFKFLSVSTSLRT